MSDDELLLKALRWLDSWKAFDTDGPETIPCITPRQRRELAASLKALLQGVQDASRPNCPKEGSRISEDRMTKAEAQKGLAKATMVKVWVKTTSDDGLYLQIPKATARRLIDESFETHGGRLNAFLADGGVFVIG